VYLRTIFELNRRYGFTKFVIVVPSVAIKEGVYKTLQITEEHFRSLYANTPFEYLRLCDYQHKRKYVKMSVMLSVVMGIL
jgi:restriction endonuclease